MPATDQTTTTRAPAGGRRPMAPTGSRARRRSDALVAAVLLVGGALGLAACGDDGAGASGSSPASTGAGPGTTVAMVADQTVTAVLTSTEKQLNEIGPGGRVVYGWNHLVGQGEGSGTLGAGPVGVDMLGNVNYVDGSGEFFGFITFDFGGGNTIAVRMDGRAKATPDTSDATLEADLDVIGGTGTYVDADGVGRFTGGRPQRLGGAVEGTYTLDIAG